MIKVLTKHVAVDIEEVPTKTAAGIIIPPDPKSGADETPRYAKVIAIGDDIEEVKVGDRVLISKYCGRNIHYEDKKYRVISIDDILAIDE